MNHTAKTPAATLAELARLVGGAVVGDAGVAIDGAWPLDDAVAGSITLVDHQDRMRRLEGCRATAVVVPRGVEAPPIPAIEVDDVHAAFAAIVTHFRPLRATKPTGVDPSAIVASGATLADDVAVAAHAVIGEGAVLEAGAVVGAGSVIGADCRIGAGTLIAPRVTLYNATVVGARCRLHSGAVLGADGFGYRQVDGEHRLVPQLGNVELGDDVEIGAGTTIDRGVYGPTRVGDGTKIDNLVQIGHNCQIGRHNLICSQVGIAGSTTTGDYVVMAGQVGVRDHVHIGTGATLSAMAGVSNDVREGETVLGAPATPLRQQKLQMAAVAKLPELRKEFKGLRRQVAELYKAVFGDDQDDATGRAA